MQSVLRGEINIVTLSNYNQIIYNIPPSAQAELALGPEYWTTAPGNPFPYSLIVFPAGKFAQKPKGAKAGNSLVGIRARAEASEAPEKTFARDVGASACIA